MAEIETTINKTTAGEAADMSATPAAVASGDKYIWGIYIALCIISLVELYSASSREVASSSIGVIGPVVRHLVMLIGGFAIMWTISRRHYRDIIPFTLGFAVVSVAMMVYVLLFGEVVNGAKRSFSMFGIAIQPAEFIKLSSVLAVAWLMSRTQKRKSIGVEDSGVIMAAAVITFFGALLVPQGLTNTLLLMAISMGMMVIGGVPWKRIFVVLGIYVVAAGAYLGYELVKEEFFTPERVETVDGGQSGYSLGRLETWIARVDRFFEDSVPKYEQPINALNRQEMYSYMAQAHGGVTGVGPGNSREASRLPLAFSDYIYAIIIEDLGVIGGLTVMVLYLWLLGRASGIASRCSRAYPALLVIGMAVMVVMQAMFHMAIVTGAFPVSGQPLPLISKGGTSILVTSIAFGVMLSVSRYAVRHGAKRQVIRNEINALPEEMSAENPTQL